MLLDQLEELAFATVGVTTRALAETAGPTALTFLGWRVLVVLGAGSEQMRLRDLAAHLGTSAPSTSRLVRRLERRGLVTTGPDQLDRRGLRIGLSAEGARIRSVVLARRRELLAEAVNEPLPDELGPGLTALAERLSRWS